MGGALALGLAAHGYSVEALVSRKLSHARRVAALFPDRPQALSESQLVSLPASDLILIATPDDAINDAALKIARAQKGRIRERTVLHTSGALSSQALSPLADLGFSTGSLHPLVSITDPTAAGQLSGAFFCLEGNRAALRVARQVVRDLGGQAFLIKPQEKALYHAAAVMASGHMTALFDIALEMLGRCGLSPSRARTVLLPLVESAAANLAMMDPSAALTGTFARGDVATVQRHLAVLAEQGLPESLAAYLLLGRRSLSLSRVAARRKKQTVATLDQILKLLNGAEKEISR